ncbi:MAG TPA: sigma-54-dependent Fis family transcriptional regulator [Cryomorphaceae bacterium]|nr:sigma-54-dependent Fis family transcriptional regulator [Owenweeksia sp.]MBF99927.1 sigma-54-dependent Fis family transcriptional regulator [Owenweeksia sp.]HAD96364.1 sigma-54-dependent Fis family transcriptional regulator [Cryomorphaceae bacterium]HBF20418.1 sigma-54-dependent Fis family transcriptional regulator [Cryomorphaceae bacterium]|tara:strand:- start:6066 stop:7427 length:1362 start_codon:yes stop_codon:yes gene_type:complete
METSHCILIVDDDEDILTSARLLLKQHYSKVHSISDPQTLNHNLAKFHPDLVLLDMNFRKGVNDGREGLYWLNHIKEVSPATQVIMMTAYGEVELAVAAIKKGAYDFVLKPWTNEKLLLTIDNALKLGREKKKVEQLEYAKASLEDSIGLKDEDFVSKSPAMKKVLETIRKVSATDANVLLLGENGTGKSVLAMAIHRLSPRLKNSFITVDLGALNENLFESELFGHKKGAFTDAHSDKPGRFEVAHEGTIFLDEIGNLTLPLQAKMLTAIQNRKVTRLGENRERPVDVRLISATNMPVRKMVEEGNFRQDLLYRINTVEIEVPPLRERREDIPILAKRFLDRFSKKYQKPRLHFSEEAIDRLCEYHWPGNIRELEHTIERAVIMNDGNQIHHFGLELSENHSISPNNLNLEEMEKHLIVKALEKFKGNISRAANELGLTRAALYRRMEKHDL